MLIQSLLLLYLSNGNCLELQTIGIYSLCNGNYTQNEFTQFAHAIELVVDKHPLIRADNGFDITGLNTIYKSFDVCFDHDKLLSVLIDIALSSKHYAINDSSIWNQDVLTFKQGMPLWQKIEYTVTAQRSSMVTRIIAHIPHDMLQTLLDVLSLETHIIFTIHSTLIETTKQMNSRVNFFNMRDSYDDVKDFLISKGWKNVVVFRNPKYHHYYTPNCNGIVERLRSVKGNCLKTLTVHSEEGMRKRFNGLYQKLNKTNHVIVIDCGTPYGGYEYNFQKNASYFNDILEIRPFNRRSYDRPTFSLRKFIEIISRLRRTGNWLSEMVYSEFFKNKTALKSKVENYRSALTALYWSTSYFRIDINGSNFNWSDVLFDLNWSYHYVYGGNSGGFNGNVEPTITGIKSECYHPRCSEGTEKVYGNLNTKSNTTWDQEIGYFCQPCQNNYIKSFIGDGQCQPCKGYYVSNEKKTQCIDPLIQIHHMPADTSGIILLCICTIGAIFCLFGFAILIIYRRTPIVKISDFIMSLIHLLVIFLYFCSAPVLLFISPTSEICMGRTLSIALFYNLNTLIIFTKSNKVMKAFLSKTRSTEFEVLKTTLIQAFTIIVNLLSAALLVGVLWSHQHPEVRIRLDIDNTRKILYCSNGLDNIALSCLMLVLHLACFIQAFRCRKLPGHVNESMSIVYASFIATVSLCVMFPIYFFQKVEENGELVIALVLAGNNLILFLFMYMKKFLIIFLKPEKNSKVYYRRKQLEAMQFKARKFGARQSNEDEVTTLEL